MRTSLAVTIAFLSAAPLFAEPRLEVLGHFDWTSYAEDFGGLSGLDVSPDGTKFVAVSDSGILYQGQFLRGADGSLDGVKQDASSALVIETGLRPEFKKDRDMEGLAISENGDIHVSTENVPKILTYRNGSDTPTASPLPRIDQRAQSNKGFEALAITPDGHFVAISEGSRNIRAPFDILQRTRDDHWEPIFPLPRNGGFRPVGADFGPDGHLYVLTRAFSGFAFASRIERVLFENGKPVTHQNIYQSRFGQFDNLEGLATWRAGTNDLRLYAISDDNFSSLQTTQIVEFLLQE